MMNDNQKPGSGSAENMGKERQQQTNRSKSLSEDQKKDIGADINVPGEQISSIEELGGLSGRDDSSGGTGDRMENENTGEKTDS